MASTQCDSSYAHRYVSRQELEEALELEAARVQGRITFFDVPPQVIDDIYSDGNPKAVSFFDKTEQIITMKVLSLEHARATFCVEQMVWGALDRCHMRRAMAVCKDSTAPYFQCQLDSGKQADAAWQLRPQYRAGRPLRDWPQIVVETGRAEGEQELLADCRRWFEQSNSAVRLVLLANIIDNQLEVTAYTPSPVPGTFGHEEKIVAKVEGMKMKVEGNDGKLRVPFATIFYRNNKVEGQDFELWGSDMEEAFQDLVEGLAELKGEQLASVEYEDPGKPEDMPTNVISKHEFPKNKKKK